MDTDQLKQKLSDAISAIDRSGAAPDLVDVISELATRGASYAYHVRELLQSAGKPEALRRELVITLDRLENPPE